MCGRRLLAVMLLVFGASSAAWAQTDEIQVYDAALTAPGKFNLTLHNNFTPKGLTAPAFPGALISDKSWNGVPEWAYGITGWIEGGLYLPLYSIGSTGTGSEAMLDGFKLRVLVAVPNAAQRRFFYGANFEFSYNARHWAPTRVASELRPIVGWRFGRVDLIVNPILDTDYTGAATIEFAPCARVAYRLSAVSAVAVEEYANFGAISHLLSGLQQAHQIFAVYDRTVKRWSVEAGAGFGLTAASDSITLKLMLSRDLW